MMMRIMMMMMMVIRYYYYNNNHDYHTLLSFLRCEGARAFNNRKVRAQSRGPQLALTLQDNIEGSSEVL